MTAKLHAYTQSGTPWPKGGLHQDILLAFQLSCPCHLRQHKLQRALAEVLLWLGRLLPVQGALWAACALLAKALVWPGCPGVKWLVEVAAPVHWFVALGQQLLWLDSISVKVPLVLNDVCLDSFEAVANARLAAGADGTAAASPPVLDSSLPSMVVPTGSFHAQPPGSEARTAGDVRR